MSDDDTGFDPKTDWPPVGAAVVMSGWRFVFEEGDSPGWWRSDGRRYARPFDSTGQVLASLWAAQTRRAGS